jgi:hypothetical protein
MAKTLREKITDSLTKMGEQQIHSKSGKYVTFTREAGGFYFIGKAGALRFGQSSSKSIPVSTAFYNFLIKE